MMELFSVHINIIHSNLPRPFMDWFGFPSGPCRLCEDPSRTHGCWPLCPPSPVCPFCPFAFRKCFFLNLWSVCAATLYRLKTACHVISDNKSFQEQWRPLRCREWSPLGTFPTMSPIPSFHDHSTPIRPPPELGFQLPTGVDSEALNSMQIILFITPTGRLIGRISGKGTEVFDPFPLTPLGLPTLSRANFLTLHWLFRLFLSPQETTLHLCPRLWPLPIPADA